MDPLTVALISQGVGQGINYLAGRSAEKDMDKARKRQEEEQAMLDAIASFRRTSPGQARVAATPSGATRGLSILAQLAPLAVQYGAGRFGGGPPKTPNTQMLSAPERNLRSSFMLD
jgi:hypothetical protein